MGTNLSFIFVIAALGLSSCGKFASNKVAPPMAPKVPTAPVAPTSPVQKPVEQVTEKTPDSEQKSPSSKENTLPPAEGSPSPKAETKAEAPTAPTVPTPSTEQNPGEIEAQEQPAQKAPQPEPNANQAEPKAHQSTPKAQTVPAAPTVPSVPSTPPMPETLNPTTPISRTETPVLPGTDLKSLPLPELRTQSHQQYVSESISEEIKTLWKAFQSDLGQNPQSAQPFQKDETITTANFDFKTGKPNFAYTKMINVRFRKSINKGVEFNTMSSSEQYKWTRIFSELRKASDIQNPEQGKYLFIDKKTAVESSLAYEKFGITSAWGAWTVAVGATAVRHKIVRVSCAEFVSEMLRQAYRRAGYDIHKDFSESKGNESYGENAQSVRGLSKSLEAAGWIAWDASLYIPPVGAPTMHEAALSPGHTYITAGERGMVIIDNVKPKGRDLRTLSARYVGMMYRTGVFFLPPGFNPKPWSPAP